MFNSYLIELKEQINGTLSNNFEVVEVSELNYRQ